MKRYFIRGIGTLLVLSLLLAIIAGVSQNSEVRQERNEISRSSSEGTQETYDTVHLACLALVGGAVLLAGGVWLGQMRRLMF